MRDKVCMVTGATDGIGEATAAGLARAGATLIIVGRHAGRGATAVARIQQRTGNAGVDFLLADLSSLADIRRLAQHFHERYRRLDVLVNNVGGLFVRQRRSVDGFEMTFALNHLSYFLLTHLLLDTIRASAPARIVNVSSAMHWGAKPEFRYTPDSRRYFGPNAYGQSKLANILFTYELTRRLAGTGVTTNALHPGFVATHFGVGHNPLGRLIKRVVNLAAIPVEEGARTSLYLAMSPEVESVTGKYFVDCTAMPSSSETYDRTAALRLWQDSERLTGIAVSQPA